MAEQEQPQRDPRNTVQPVHMAMAALPNSGFKSPEQSVASGLVSYLEAPEPEPQDQQAKTNDTRPMSDEAWGELLRASLFLGFNKDTRVAPLPAEDITSDTPRHPSAIVPIAAHSLDSGGPLTPEELAHMARNAVNRAESLQGLSVGHEPKTPNSAGDLMSKDTGLDIRK